MRNAELYGALRAYSRAAVTALASKLAERGDGGESLHSVHRFTLGPKGSLHESEGDRIAWDRVLLQWRDVISEMDETRFAVEALEADDTVAKHLGREVWIPGHHIACPRSGSLLEHFVTEVIDQGEGRFQDPIFDRVYKGLEDFFYQDRLELRILAPLGGFQMEVAQIELGSGLRIVSLTQQHVDEMLPSSRAWGPVLEYSKPWPGLRPCAFELHLQMKKSLGRNAGQLEGDRWRDHWALRAQERFEQASSALRVFKGGELWYDDAVGRYAYWHPWARVVYAHQLAGQRADAVEPYRLSKQDAAEFLQFWNSWGKGKRFKDLEVGVRRFSAGCERLLVEDRLIDYMIALEALLLRDVHGELSYRMSLRGAALLGESPFHRAAVRRNLTEAYNIRNDFVHGSAKKHETVKVRQPDKSERRLNEKMVPLREFVDLVGDYLRCIVRKLERRVEAEALTDVMVQLDDSVARGFGTAKQP